MPRYIKTSGNATVDHLSKYLAVRLALEDMRKNGEASPINVDAASEKQYTIYISTANSSQFTVSYSSLTYLLNGRSQFTVIYSSLSYLLNGHIHHSTPSSTSTS